MACELCELAASLDAAGELVPVGRYWTANVRQSADRPAIVLQVREHRSGLEGLQAAEAAELGGVVQRTAAQLEDAPGVERVYAQSYNETPGHHVHVHVVPRFRGEHDLGPKAAADATPPPAFDIDAVVRRLASAPGTGGLLTQRVRRALGWLTRIPVAGKDRHPYSYLQRNMSRTASRGGCRGLPMPVNSSSWPPSPPSSCCWRRSSG